MPKRRMRMPNGFGSVIELKGNRRKPYAVRITKGWKMEKGKAVQDYRYIGYFEKWSDAMTALVDYNKNPYDLNLDSLTVAEVYEEWASNHYPTVSKSTARAYKSIWENALSSLHDLPIRSVKANHLEKAIESVGKSRNAAITILNGTFNLAMRREYIDKNYMDIAKPSKNMSTPNGHERLSENNILEIISNDGPLYDLALVQLYTGLRPGEVLSLESENVNLDERYMVGGLKTKAGKNRVIPIHPDILPIVTKYLNLGGKYLFNKPFSYPTYLNKFKELLPGHRPHDMRVTFASIWKEQGLNENILKVIIGHSISDLTERVYTKRTISNLRDELDKFKLFSK